MNDGVIDHGITSVDGYVTRYADDWSNAWSANSRDVFSSYLELRFP